MSPLCLSGIVGAVDSTAQRPSHSPWVQAHPLTPPIHKHISRVLGYPALLSQPDLYHLIDSKPWEEEGKRGHRLKSTYTSCHKVRSQVNLVFLLNWRGGSDGVFWTEGQNSTGSDESPREIGGGTQLLQEAILYGSTEHKTL